MEIVECEKRRCESILQTISSGIPKRTNISPASIRTLRKLVSSELNFLSALRSAPSHLSSNVGHLESLVHLLARHPDITGVSRVCKPIPVQHHGVKTLHVDIVCSLHGFPVWVVVSERNPKNLDVECFLNRLQRVIDLCNSDVALAARPSAIVVFFSRGADSRVSARLQKEFSFSNLKLPSELCEFEFGFFDRKGDLEGWVEVIPGCTRSYKDACLVEIKLQQWRTESKLSLLGGPRDLTWEESDLMDDAFGWILKGMDSSADGLHGGNLVNFDTTALVAMVSGISNGWAESILAAPEEEMRRRHKGNYDFVVTQAKSEPENPLLGELAGFLFAKKGVVCEAVVSEFKGLVAMCGGPNEQRRAETLLRYLRVVHDNPSERIMKLPTTRKLTMKNKTIFGVGDELHCPTLTANMAFVRAVTQTGMSLSSIEHRPRALIGE